MGHPAAPALQLDPPGRLRPGGSAATSGYGATRATTDFDICLRWDEANLTRAATALRDLDAGVRIEGMADPVAVPLDHKMLGTMELSTWRTAAGDIDVLRGIPVRGLHDLAFYDELASRANTITFHNTKVQVATIEDLIASKEGVDRPTGRPTEKRSPSYERYAMLPLRGTAQGGPQKLLPAHRRSLTPSPTECNQGPARRPTLIPGDLAPPGQATSRTEDLGWNPDRTLSQTNVFRVLNSWPNSAVPALWGSPADPTSAGM